MHCAVFNFLSLTNPCSVLQLFSPRTILTVISPFAFKQVCHPDKSLLSIIKWAIMSLNVCQLHTYCMTFNTHGPTGHSSQRKLHVSQWVFLFDGNQYNQQDCCQHCGRAYIELSFFLVSLTIVWSYNTKRKKLQGIKCLFYLPLSNFHRLHFKTLYIITRLSYYKSFSVGRSFSILLATQVAYFMTVSIPQSLVCLSDVVHSDSHFQIH